MAKLKQIGGVSFGSEEAYNNFLSLPYKEQLKQVTASFSPQDEAAAVKALKGVSNGDSSGTKQEATANNTANVAEGNAASDSSATTTINTGKGKGTT